MKEGDMSHRRALVHALLVLLGVMAGVWIDRALLRPRSTLGPTSVRPGSDSPGTEARQDGVAGVEPKGSSTDGASPTPPKTVPLKEAEQMIREALAVADPARRSEILDEVSRLVEPSDLPEAFRRAEDLVRGDLREQFRGALLARWAAFDPKAAVETAQTIRHAQCRQTVTLKLLDTWAEKDPEGAIAWAEALAASVSREQALLVVLRKMASTDPAAAAARAGRLGASLQTVKAVIAAEWGKKNPRAAMAWVKGLPEKGKAAAYAGLVPAIAPLDPAAAADLVTSMPAAEYKQQVVSDLAAEWAGRDL